MHKLRCFALALLAAVAFSCGGSEDEPAKGGSGGSSTSGPTIFNVNASQTSLTPDAQTVVITITCNAAWSVSSNADWLTANPASGTGTTAAAAITASVALNKTTDSRTGTLTFTSGSQNRTISIAQKPITDIINTQEIFLVKQTPAEVSVNIKGNWTVSIPSADDSWLTVTPKSGNGSATVTLQAKDDNENVGDRKPTLTFTIGSDTVDIPVTQKQKNVIVFAETSTTRDYQAGTFDIPTNTNVDFSVEVTEGGDWLHYVQTKALNSRSSTFRIDQNPDNKARTARITFSFEDLSEVHDVVQGPFNSVIGLSIPGVYGFAGNDYVYTAGRDQESVFTKQESIGYRLLFPKETRVAEISGIPADAAAGAAFEASFKLLEGREKLAEFVTTVYVVKADETFLWLSLADGTGIIVKK